MATPHAAVLVVQRAGRQEALWRAALASQGVDPDCLAVPRLLPALSGGDQAGIGAPPVAVIVADLPTLADHGVTLDDVTLAAGPAVAVYATLGSRMRVFGPERRWARSRGAAELLPARSLHAPLADLPDDLAAICRRAGAGPPDAARFAAAMRRLAAEAAHREGDAAARLAVRGIAVEEVAARMCGPAGVAVEHRRFRLAGYRSCFIGRDAVDWLASNYGLDRGEAVSLGRHLQSLGWLHHVVKEQPFQDGYFFYRFGGDLAALESIEIDALVQRMRSPGGVAIGERSYLGRPYPACLVGDEAVDWFVQSFGIDRDDGVAVGQRLLDLTLLHHVLDEHDFLDGHYFYRFRCDEPRTHDAQLR